jgi:hypothetical protein
MEQKSIPPLDRVKELFTLFGLKNFKAHLPAHKQQFIELQNTSMNLLVPVFRKLQY